MNEINLLKQASLADKMGNYRLADNLFNSAYRYAQAPAAAEAAAKALEEVIAKIGIESAERAALEAGEKTIAEALAKDGGIKLLQFLEMKGIAAASAAKAGDEAAIRNLVESAGYTGRALEKQVAAIKGAPSEEAAKELSKGLAARIKLRVMAGKGLPKPLLKLPEGVTKIYDSVKGVAEWAKGSKIGTKWLELMLKYPAASRILKGLGYTYVATKAGSFLLNTITGEILDPAKIYDKIVSMIPSFTPGTPESTLPGSGSDINIEDEDGEDGEDEDGTAGTPDPTTAPGFQYKTKEEMFERRMKTTPNQQTMKGSKPQEFVDANKGNYKTQREFYDAAFAAEDKNFANSVIALVKKDLDLPVSAQEPRKF